MAIFSGDGYFKNTPVWVKKVSLSVKALCGFLAGTAYLNDRMDFIFIIGLIGFLIDELLKFIKVEEKVNREDE